MLSKRRKTNAGAKRSLAMSSEEALMMAEEIEETEELDISTPPKPSMKKQVPLSYVPYCQPDADPIRIRHSASNCSDVLDSVKAYLLQEYYLVREASKTDSEVTVRGLCAHYQLGKNFFSKLSNKIHETKTKTGLVDLFRS